MSKQRMAVRMYDLWRQDRLPKDVKVIETAIERTGYSDFRIPEYWPPKYAVADEDRNPAPNDHIRTIAVDLGRDGAGNWLALGWNEHPPVLIVGWEKERE